MRLTALDDDIFSGMDFHESGTEKALREREGQVMTLCGIVGVEAEEELEDKVRGLVQNHDHQLVETIYWLREKGFYKAANALAALHCEECGLRGVNPLVFCDEDEKDIYCVGCRRQWDDR